MLRFTARDSSLSFIKHQIYGRCNFSSCRISSKIAASSISTAVGPRPTAVKNPCSITDRSNFHGSHNPVFRFLPSVYGNRGMAKKSRNSSAQTQKAGAAAPPDDALEPGVEKTIFTNPAPNQFRLMAASCVTHAGFWTWCAPPHPAPPRPFAPRADPAAAAQGVLPALHGPHNRLPRGLVVRPGRRHVRRRLHHGVVARAPARRAPLHRPGRHRRDRHHHPRHARCPHPPVA